MTRKLKLADVSARDFRNAQGRFATIGGDPPNLAEPIPGCPFAPRCPHVVDDCRSGMPRTSVDRGHAVRCLRYD